MSEESPEKFFSKHATNYASNESFSKGSDLTRLIELLNPVSSYSALDIATGTGFTAIELAKKVKLVVAVDITEEMLNEARRLSKERGIENVRFEKADAASLPYSSESFDIVTTRRASHHFRDVTKFLQEARRVLKSQGRIGIADMSPVQGTEEFFNQIDKIRDSTHNRALSPEEWVGEIKLAGFSIVHMETLDERVTFENWLYPVKMGGAEEKEIRKAWANSSEQVRNLLKVSENNGNVESWVKTRIVLVALK